MMEKDQLTYRLIIDNIYGGTRSVIDTATRVQIVDEADCISHSINALGKGMNLLILPPAMGKYKDRLGSSALVRQLV